MLAPPLSKDETLARHELALDATAKEFPSYPRELIESVLFEEFKRVERERCTTDLFYLAHDILGYSDLTESIHRPLCQLVESVNPLIIAQRERALKVVTTSATHATTTATEQHVDNMAEWFGYTARTDFGGKGEGGVSGPTPPQNFIKYFNLPNNDTINKLLDEKIIQFNPESRTRLFLLFRGAFKSTIITIAHTIQLMLIWPDIRILIASHKKEGGSQKFLGSIKDHFIRNERFRNLFPEYCPKANSTGQIDWGTSEQVTLPNRSATAIYPEATIEIAGNTTDVTGRHYNYLKIDDIVTRESVTNESMLERTEEFNALLTFLFDQPEWGIKDYSGTCYHFADLYAVLRDSPQITKFILPVWDENEVPTIPERFTHDGIQKIKDDPSQTSYQFSAQYMMNPVPEEDQTFRPAWWKREGFYYDVLPNNLRVTIFVDPANSQNKKSDYTSLFVVGIDESGDYWVLDMVRDKLDVEGRATLAINFAIKHGIHKINYESVGFQNTDAYIIKKLAQERHHYIEVNELKATMASKEDRIRALQPIFERGTIHLPRKYEYYSKYHKRSIDMVSLFNREAWMFPKNEHDDMIDCLSQLCRVTLYSPSKIKNKEEDNMFNKMRQLAIDAKKPKKVFNGFGQKIQLKGRQIPAKKAFF